MFYVSSLSSNNYEEKIRILQFYLIERERGKWANL